MSSIPLDVQPHANAAPGLLRVLRSFWLTFACALALGFAFQGSRGLWETDEGRYTQVAMEMLRSGDYITPRRHAHHIHPTKPPLTYWAIASSVGQFGRNEWAVRAPYALAFALTVGLLFGIGRRLTPALPGLPAAIHATTALSFFAANLVTTDTLLTLMTTLAVFGYVGARWPLREDHRAWPWIVLMWSGFGLAFVTKGPPGLLPLAAILAFDAIQPQHRTRQLFDPRALLAFAVIGLSWYVAVVLRNPGLMTYLIEEEVVARVASSEHGRFPQWWGGFYVYGFTLLLGTLPWLPTVWRRIVSFPRTRAGWSQLAPETKFLALWIVLQLCHCAVRREAHAEGHAPVLVDELPGRAEVIRHVQEHLAVLLVEKRRQRVRAIDEHLLRTVGCRLGGQRVPVPQVAHAACDRAAG